MDSTVLFNFARFSGMNTVEKEFRMPVVKDPMGNPIFDVALLENLDIDNSFVVGSRKGGVLKTSGSGVHSGWSDGEIALFVEGEVLKLLNADYTTRSLGTIGSGRLSCAPVNDRIYLTNGTYIGYLQDGAVVSFVDPGKAYKVPLPPGKFIEHYLGRMYVAKGPVLYIADPLATYYDIRTGFKVFENDISMLISVDDGVYVADSKTYFLSGSSPDEFQKKLVLDEAAVPYTVRRVNGASLKEGLSGNYAVWVSRSGIYVGDSRGTVEAVSGARYDMPAHGFGSSAVRSIGGVVHYIASLE